MSSFLLGRGVGSSTLEWLGEVGMGVQGSPSPSVGAQLPGRETERQGLVEEQQGPG